VRSPDLAVATQHLIYRMMRMIR